MNPCFFGYNIDATNHIELRVEDFQNYIRQAYKSGFEDGKNKALAEVCKEQWMPYKHITYPTYSPYVTPNYYSTGDGDINWSNIDVTCNSKKGDES